MSSNPQANETTAIPMNSLENQVRSLRLPKRTQQTTPVSAWLGWVLCLFFAALSGYLGFKLRSLPQSTVEDANGANGSDSGGTATTTSTTSGSSGSSSGTGTGSSTPLAERPKSAADSDIALLSRGYITPAHQVLVSPEVSGRVLELHFEEGMRVEKGFVLAKIDPTDYRNDQLRVKASLELAKQRLLELENGNRPEEVSQAEAELRESEAQLKQLEAKFKRDSELNKSRTLSDQDFEQAESSFRAMQRRVDRLKLGLTLMQQGPRAERIAAARAEVQQAEAELAKAEWKLSKCDIVAPISGTILRKNAEQGNIVNPVAFNGSFSVCDMADLADLEVELDIMERDVSRVFKGQQCRVRTEAFRDRNYNGFVSRLMPIADRAKGSVPVRVKLIVPPEEEGVFLKPQMAADVTFLNSAHQP